MRASASKTVRELALENPHATQIFEQLGIDYCCGGEKPLSEACSAAKLSVDEVLARLEAQQHTPVASAGKDWQQESLETLIEHITTTHHTFVRSESPRITALLTKVGGVHGSNHPELQQVREVFAELAGELSSHMMKEEQILFPHIVAAEKRCAAPTCFGSVQSPIEMMMFEHDNAGNALRELRQLTNNYAAPADACTSYQMLYQALPAFEADLHQHIHLENNILFPRAITQEQE